MQLVNFLKTILAVMYFENQCEAWKAGLEPSFGNSVSSVTNIGT